MELGPLQKKWIEALRSGKYKQGHSYLECDGHYCCLGVANECLNLGEMDDEFLHDTYAKLGLFSRAGNLKNEDKLSIKSLTAMNDSGKTFKEIADFIEQNPEKVFKESV